LVERLWGVSSAENSKFVHEKTRSFSLRRLGTVLPQHFKERKPDCTAGATWKNTWLSCMMQDKADSQKTAAVFLNCLKRFFQPCVCTAWFYTRHRRSSTLTASYEKSYSNDSSVILFVQFYELHFSLNIYCKKEECNGLHLIKLLIHS